MRILRRFTERKRIITLFFVLATWVPLCDGQRRDDAAVPFLSPVWYGNAVVGITRLDAGYELLGLRGHYRPGCSSPGRDLLCTEGLNHGFLCPHSCIDSPHPLAIPFSTHLPVGYFVMSSSEETQRNDAVTDSEMGRSSSFVRSSVKSLIKVLSGQPPKIAATPNAESIVDPRTTRDIRDDFRLAMSSSLDDEIGFDGNGQNAYDGPIFAEVLRHSRNREMERGVTVETERTTPTSAVPKNVLHTNGFLLCKEMVREVGLLSSEQSVARAQLVSQDFPHTNSNTSIASSSAATLSS